MVVAVAADAPVASGEEAAQDLSKATSSTAVPDAGEAGAVVATGAGGVRGRAPNHAHPPLPQLSSDKPQHLCWNSCG